MQAQSRAGSRLPVTVRDRLALWRHERRARSRDERAHRLEALERLQREERMARRYGEAIEPFQRAPRWG